MTVIGWLQIILFCVVIVALTKPLGWYMTRVFNGERTFSSPVLRPIEAGIYWFSGVDEKGHDRRHLICVIAGSHSAMVAATAAPQPATGSPKLHEIALVAGGDTLTRTGAILFEVLPICVAHRAVGFWRHV